MTENWVLRELMTKAEVLGPEAGREPGGARDRGSFVRRAGGSRSSVWFQDKFQKRGRCWGPESPQPAHAWGCSRRNSTPPLSGPGPRSSPGSRPGSPPWRPPRPTSRYYSFPTAGRAGGAGRGAEGGEEGGGEGGRGRRPAAGRGVRCFPLASGVAHGLSETLV